MLPKNHILLGAITTIFLRLILFTKLSTFGATLIFLSSVLIDFDHYLYYAFKRHDLNLKRAYQWFAFHRAEMRKLSPVERNKYKKAIFIFHGIECWILLVLLTYIHPYFLFLLIGVAVHMFYDFIDLYTSKEPLALKFSQIYVYLRNRGKKDIL